VKDLLYISPSVIPSKSANSVHVMKMCNAFSKNGLSVELLCRKGFKKNEIFDYYGVEKNFVVTSLLGFKNTKLNSLIYAFLTLLYSIKGSFKNIYSRNQLSSIFILLFSKRSLFIELHAPPKGFYKLIFKYLVNKNRIKKIILISHALKNIINDLKIFNDNILVCHDGADLLNNNKNKIIFNKNYFDIGYVGHLYKGRGIGIIIELARKNQRFNFHIIGGNKDDIVFWKKKVIHKNIIFHGHVEPKLVPIYLKNFDILIAPYQRKVQLANGLNTASWMSPLKIFEYMSANKPILTSDLFVLKEVLIHKVNAYLCNPDKLEEWDNGLKLLFSNSKFSKKISINAYKDFLKLYTWSARSKLILKYFEK